MEIGGQDEALAIQLVGRDVEATLGPGHDDVIAHQAKLRLESLEYVQDVAEDVQQHFHDCHIDVTWPECPFHRRHPLWLHDGVWTCEKLNAPVARLGEVRTSRDDAGRYVILVDRDL